MRLKSLLLLTFVALFLGCKDNRGVEFPVHSGDKGITESNISRELRYSPDGDAFVIENGDKKYTRSLYGGNSAFRVLGGDVPDFMLFSGGKDGLIRLGLSNSDSSQWLDSLGNIETRYVPGKLIYTITDSLLGDGKVIVTVLASHSAEKLLMKITSEGDIAGNMVFMVGSASRQRFFRNADLNTDSSPEVFAFKAEECKSDTISLNDNGFSLRYNSRKGIRSINGVFSSISKMVVSDLAAQSTPNELLSSEAAEAPVLAASIDLASGKTDYVSFEVAGKVPSESNKSIETLFDEAETARAGIAGMIKINTPDIFMNPIGGACAIAADGCWEDPSWLHGASGWRTRLNGWRAGYIGDVVGWNDRANTHFTAYNKSQVTEMNKCLILPGDKENLARESKNWESVLYSSGYIMPDPNGSKKRMLHYDMNLVYIDALLNHILWTGDMQFARQSWPIIERHLAWEKRCFDPFNESLYDGYCCIWASDALQYSGGNVTHSSAYNYRANKLAAELATRLGKSPEPYIQEAERIRNAMNDVLWLPQKGVYAEFKDRLGNKMLHENPAVWTVYHTIDSDVPDAFGAYLMTRYIDNEIPHFPIKGSNVPDGYSTISTSNWHPYSWSINNVAFAEVAHTALSYWQAGRAEEAYNLWKANVLDFMYMGSVPGNFGQISYYDAARGEVYSDFSDPIGIGSRAIVEGLFGIVPNELSGELLLRPGIPSEWEYASISTPYIDYDYKRDGNTETYSLTQRFNKKMAIRLVSRAVSDHIVSASVNGKPIDFKVLEKVGYAAVEVVTATTDAIQNIEIEWGGKPFEKNEPIVVPSSLPRLSIDYGDSVYEVYDPQEIVEVASPEYGDVNGYFYSKPGKYTIFAKVRQGDFVWWMPKHVTISESIEVVAAETQPRDGIAFSVKNNLDEMIATMAEVNVNGSVLKMNVEIPSKSEEMITIPAKYCVTGTNNVEVTINDYKAVGSCLNWSIVSKRKNLESVDINEFFNDSVSCIYRREYMSPRPQQLTLQLPKHGYGNWCHYNDHPVIADSGFRASIDENGQFMMLNKLWFASPKEGENIAFVSKWDNYPDQITIPLKGYSPHAYLLMAGSTNHMQSRIENGRVTVKYADGSETVLKLVNPDNWWSIEQDMHIDDFAFRTAKPSPLRIALKTGEAYLVGKGIGVENFIDGGAASVLDVVLDSEKELESITISATANDVVIGLMAITL